MAAGGRLPTLERISKEFVDIDRAPPANCKAAPVNPSDMFKLGATIQGPRGSAFEDGTFKLDITFPADYPFRPPQVKFKSKINHPNTDWDGNICFNMLTSIWTLAQSISKLLTAICWLMSNPSVTDPRATNGASGYRKNRGHRKNTAREWTKKHGFRK
ncbi:ubiquitin-conjugating enzyme E2 D4-like [Rhipicephalus microplus]|uniref:ubiquitin-conjugating enzyme E2 D4-like n=1 Tax=Rhipicephalus microplus TaxID=6941 RepID=UPI003F6D140B